MSADPLRGTVLVQGAGGGIGLALTHALLARRSVTRLFAASREPDAPKLRELAADARVVLLPLDVEEPGSVAEAAKQVGTQTGHLDLLVNCAGLLHDEATGMHPERRLAAVEAHNLARAFRVNAIGSMLMAQAFESLLRFGTAPVFASISARVGSIADNRLGGWYAYRASKAALNMYLKTLAIEWNRRKPKVRVVALHPGTVATPMSAPFTDLDDEARRVFSPAQAAEQLVAVLDGLGPDTSGAFLDWQGNRVPW